MRLSFLSLPLVLVFFVILAAGASCAESAWGLRVWPVDALVKVLPSAAAPADAPAVVSVDAVRNEYESAQVVVLSDRKIERLTVKVGPVQGPDGAMPAVTTNFVGFVPVTKGTPDTPDDKLAFAAPVDAPDPLLEVHSISLEAGRAQPIWVTVHVPKDARPGVYVSSVEVTGDGERVAIPLRISVHRPVLPDERTLNITNWFFPEIIARAHGLTEFSEPFWKMMETYAQFLADHRQTQAMTTTQKLVKRVKDSRGRSFLDFSDFDRWVEMFHRANIRNIEGGGFVVPAEGQPGQFAIYPIGLANDPKLNPGHPVLIDSPEGQEFMAEYLPALQKHLEKKGWLDCYYQHLGDEPNAGVADAYKRFATNVKRYAPKIKIIEASMCWQVVGAVNVWAVQPPQYEIGEEFFNERERQGDKVWFYTCCGPAGKYMNRMIDFPLLDVRLLHWANFRYGIEGYLHWGLNFWRGDPFKDITMDMGGQFLPPGDTHIIYPGLHGPLSSIRFEAMRDGIEDYELLSLLAKKHPKEAREISRSIVRSFSDFCLDPGEFRKARARLVAGLERS